MPLNKLPLSPAMSMQTPRPGLFIFLLDASGSMSETCSPLDPGTSQFARDMGVLEHGGTEIDKNSMLSLVFNEALNQLLSSAARMVDVELARRFQVCALEFAGDCRTAITAQGGPLERLWPQEIADQAVTRKMTQSREGRTHQVDIFWWLDPFDLLRDRVQGTNFHEALSRAEQLVEQFRTDHPDHYPPQVILITDGENNLPDGKPDAWKDVARRLAAHSVLWMIHVAKSPARTGIVADSPARVGITDQDLIDMYEFSSAMPETFVSSNKSIHVFPDDTPEPACFAYNATPRTLRNLLALIRMGTTRRG